VGAAAGSGLRANRPATPLGVGITYSAAIEPVLADDGLVDFLEVEPQTMWLEHGTGPKRFSFSEDVLAHIVSLPGRKLVHSVGAPVGGSVVPQPEQLALLQATIERLTSPYFSDHLSFNATPEFHTGFFLPPRQTEEGVRTVLRSLRVVQDALSVPVAVETGVNYLRPRRDEMPDGAFVREVVEAADCGVLLDLHNAFANDVNGREPIETFLAQLPLERVWEIHLAGGMELDDFWLDAHSGAIPETLLTIAREVIPHLPNLVAINFEIFPSFVANVGPDVIRRQLERLRELWALRDERATPRRPLRLTPRPPAGAAAHPDEWERALGSLVIGRPESNHPLTGELERDPGVKLMRDLVGEFRASMVVGALRLSSRLMMLTLGPQAFQDLLAAFWRDHPPQAYAITEARAFAAFVRSHDPQVPQLLELLEFETSVLATLSDGEARVVPFERDPVPLLRALAEGRLPEIDAVAGAFEIEVTPDGPSQASGVALEDVQQAFPFH
jgi:uncharacterized protein